MASPPLLPDCTPPAPAAINMQAIQEVVQQLQGTVETLQGTVQGLQMAVQRLEAKIRNEGSKCFNREAHNDNPIRALVVEEEQGEALPVGQASPLFPASKVAVDYLTKAQLMKLAHHYGYTIPPGNGGGPNTFELRCAFKTWANLW